ncbi:MAG: PEPxxWA-CTERM sorting domain-containing protein [Phenylobacterium sp.]|uniref:PEPxxWA-CTERM sorting domain-containing protein n=1 Tax=Phenylobacterium sp. TaxID=1871053 RepID=UPI0027322E77|nr:PEPxxWA-CTERM sorting domain-containing protein [Phenylobacterium sp.]MDP3747922.1 PEPxxWA-CTERM sorting domain-containing protein [Phenylobacterium sp.]
MSKLVAPVAAAALLAWAGSASSASVVVQGQLVAELGYPYVDPHLSLGDPVTALITFDPYKAIQLGKTGYSLAPMSALHVSSNGFTMPFSDIYDHEPIAVQYFETNCEAEFGPGCSHTDETRFVTDAAILYKGSTVIGLIGTSAPSDFDIGPDYDLGSSMDPGPDATDYIGWHGYCLRQSNSESYDCDGRGNWTATSDFWIKAPTYTSTYYTQGFRGVWDFDGARIVGIPEPSTWAMMIMGFGLAGAALRRRAVAA